jgi:hypothetical protein
MSASSTAKRKGGPKDLRSRFGFHSPPFTRELAIDRRLRSRTSKR